MIGYHVTWTSVLPDIFAQGLLPSEDGTEGPGVYLFRGDYPQVLIDVMDHVCDYFLAELEEELTPETEDDWIAAHFSLLKVDCPGNTEQIFANIIRQPDTIPADRITEIKNWVPDWYNYVHSKSKHFK